MNALFTQHVKALVPKFRELMTMMPHKAGSLPLNIPESGVYLFSETENHLYVGRSKKLKQRLREHGRGDFRKAAFAFLLARERTELKATYQTKNSRADLMTQPKFREAFSEASKRIQLMDIRFVEETDTVRQALLEIYTAISLNTKYNTFETT